MKKRKHLIVLMLISSVVLKLNAQPNEISGTGIMDLTNSTIAIGDFNNDGDLDIVISGENSVSDHFCKVYSNNGDNTFSDIGATIMALAGGDIALADFNADNYLDIAICGTDQSGDPYSKIYQNNQNNTFIEVTASLTGLTGGSADWGDFDSDGDLDLLLCGRKSDNTRTTLVYENTGSDFTEVDPGIPDIAYGQATFNDINSDGFADIAISGINNSNAYVTEFYLNDGDKTFTSYNANLQKLAYSEQQFIDYDNDGDLDFFIAGSDNGGTEYMNLYKNNSGNFTKITETFTPLWNVSASWSDYDADGDIDLIYTGRDGVTPTTHYYQNNGSDNFSHETLGLQNISEGDIAWFDFNNDNTQDILISGSTSSANITVLYANDITNSNTAPSAPTSLSADANESKATLSWTASSDTETSANGLSYRIALGTSSGNYNISTVTSNTSTGKNYLPKQGWIKGTSVTFNNLPEGQYYWRVQAIDASNAGSPLSTEGSFAICAPLDLGEDKEICNNNALELSAGEETDIVNWYSENDGQIASNTQNLSHIINQNDEIRAEVIKSIGCTSRDTIAVTTLALPTISLPATGEACYGDTLVYEAGEAGETVQWFAENDALLQSGNQIEYKVVQNETIKCEVTGTNSCLDSAKVAITYLALPEASLGDDFGVCNTQNTQLEITGMQTVNWYALPWTEIAVNQSQITINVNSDTSIVAKFTDANSCVNYDTINIASNQTITVNAGNDTTICFNTSLDLGGSPTASNGQAPYTYEWTDAADDQFSSEANPTVTPGTTTSYTINVTDQNGCEGNDMINVQVNPQIEIDAGAETDICYGNTAELGGNPTADNSLFSYTYYWWPETGLSDPNDANPEATPLDTITYRLIVNTYNCASDTAFVTVNVVPLPEISITEDHSIGFGETTQLEASGGILYEWSPTDGLSDAYSAATDASPDATTTYIVTVTDEAECQSQAAVKVEVKNDFFIPSLFTPNGDGNNDFFRIYGTGVEEINMIVYNRNGNIVFQTNDVNFLLETGWDGTSNGAKQPQGSYMYVISGRFVDGSLIDFNGNKGTINLIR